jgi:hypothetical protein
MNLMNGFTRQTFPSSILVSNFNYLQSENSSKFPLLIFFLITKPSNIPTAHVTSFTVNGILFSHSYIFFLSEIPFCAFFATCTFYEQLPAIRTLNQTFQFHVKNHNQTFFTMKGHATSRLKALGYCRR